MSKRNRKVLKSRIRAPAVKNSGYSDGGASFQKDALRSWYPQRLSSKSDIDANLVTLRNRAADQATNTPLGSAAIVTSTMHAVGAGLRLFPRIPYKFLGLTAEEARDWERNTVREFKLWAGSKECDWRRRNNFYDLQNIAYATYLTDGDSFALFRRANPSFSMPYTLRIQLLEANRVNNPLGGAGVGYSEANAWGVEQLNTQGIRQPFVDAVSGLKMEDKGMEELKALITDQVNSGSNGVKANVDSPEKANRDVKAEIDTIVDLINKKRG